MSLMNSLMTQRTKRNCVLLRGGPFPSFVVEKCNQGVLLKLVSGLHKRRLFLLVLLFALHFRLFIQSNSVFSPFVNSPFVTDACSSDIGRTLHPAPASTAVESCPVPPPEALSARSSGLNSLGIR